MKKFLIPVGALLCLAPLISSGVALLLGVTIALAFGNPYLTHTRKLTHSLLAFSVVGLGAGMDLGVVGRVGLQGIGYTVVGIGTAILLGLIFGKLFNTAKDTSVLITVGTAICGGSAIAAVSPVIKAKHHEVSVSLGVVFLLNALALFIFPPIGHALELTQHQFGLWCALAIHDTSSVVGASLQYGSEAVQIATTVKLARALWIVPVTLAIGFIYSMLEKSAVAATVGTGGTGATVSATITKPKMKKPWFILGFLIVAALVTWFPVLKTPGHYVDLVAKRALVATLFLIGASLTRETIKNVGVKPFLHGIALWLVVGSATLGAILIGWIR